MITIKINYKLDDFNKKLILNKQKQSSALFRKLYKHIQLIDNKEYISYLTKIYQLSVYEVNCIIIDVKTKFKQTQTQKDKICKDIVEIDKQIKSLKTKNLTKKETRKLFKLQNKLIYKNKSLSKDITFGSRKLLRQISFLNNDKELNKKQIKLKTSEYQSNRILPLSYYGSKNDKNSNRYFEFDFINDFIVYKMNKSTKIKIEYTLSSSYKNQLIGLQSVKDLGLIPISVTLTDKYLCISFDNEIVNGEPFDTKNYFNELNQINGGKYDKDTFIKYKNKQRDRKLLNKNINHYGSVDLNPQFIGLSILKKTKNSFKVIDTKCFDLTELLKKSGKDSSSEESKYINDKRKYEIGVIYSKIFNLLNHYKCAYFVMEDLNFKSNSKDDFVKEVKRKINNCWNLNFQQNLIDKHCTNKGIEIIKVNPCYSSFIGNIMFPIFDPVAAATEIGRRGIYKYNKGNNFYPVLTETILDTVVEKFGELFPDVLMIKDCKNWIELYKLFKKTEIRYRWQLNETKFKYLSKNTIRNKWNLYSF